MNEKPEQQNDEDGLFVRVEFKSVEFMKAIRWKCGSDVGNHKSLRDIAVIVGVSASTLSRIDNGFQPDMNTFCDICGKLNLMPERFFERTLWQRVKDK